MFCEDGLEKVCILAGSCDPCITTGYTATETKCILLRYEFNGSMYETPVQVTESSIIVLPNLFNENYTHKAILIDAQGGNVGNRIYSITVIPCIKV